jgi:hypothetical protein
VCALVGIPKLPFTTSGANVIKLFASVIIEFLYEARVFFLGKLQA